ncbi:hypothetical protein C7377_0568 [Balneicella halophila]|uniref:Bacterial Ig domain-containing protein n=1 Tax=Balneicella halophila TaxID=1537566 RepID=A0A7L4US70_BALHA|nr:Ig-like domain-containing protein [Balneicella halophila]PVX52261.1 hypothetical protein C7377_0568 [Balneicella halophila]
MDAQTTSNDFTGISEDLIFKTSGTPFALFEELGGTAGDSDAILGEGTHMIEYVNSYSADNSMNNRNAIFSTSGKNIVINTYASRLTGNDDTQGASFAVVLYCDTADDGIPNYLDLDSDNDECPDAIEGGTNDETDPIRSNLAKATGIVNDGNNDIVTENLCGGTDCVTTDGIPLNNSQPISQIVGGSQESASFTVANDLQNQTVCEGSEATFTATISVSSDFITTYDYQLQVSADSGSTWTDVAGQSGTDEISVFTLDVSIPSVTADMNNNLYRIFYNNSANTCGGYTNAAKLTVKDLPATPTLSTAVQPSCDNVSGTFTIDMSAYAGEKFKFNIQPSDGARIDITTGAFTDYTVGTTYSITATTHNCISDAFEFTVNQITNKDCKSDEPTIDDPTEGDDTVTGGGNPGSEIVVTFPDGGVVTTTVDEDGNWEVDVPDGEDLTPGETVTATQTDPGKDPSDEVTGTVQ